MSDMNIPGISGDGGVDSQKMIDDLMKAERKPLERMENEVDEYQDEKQVWQELRRSASQLSEQARSLYGFESPFAERVANSSDESVLTASANRRAPRSTNNIEVEQIARADRFMSEPAGMDREVAAGNYGFRVGEEEVSFEFDGGNLSEFVDAINENADDLVEARLVRDSSDTQIVTFESQVTGAENRLSFLGDAQDLALDLGVIEPSQTAEQQVSIDESSVAPWQGELSSETVQIADGTAEVRPGGSVSLPLSPSMDINEDMVLELEVRVVDRSDEIPETQPPPEGPNVPDGGSVTLDDITVPYPGSDVELPEIEQEEAPEVATDNNFLFARSSGSDVPLPELEPGEEFETIQIPLSEYVDTIEALNVRNENTHRDFYIRNARIFDPNAQGDFEPKNPIDTASDARVKLDGVTATRSTNEIDDLIPETTLELQSPSRGPVSLNVEPDKETIKESVIGFLAQYNEFMRDINILTRSNEAVIDEIQYFEDEDEREQARDRLGMLQGETSLNQMRARLQQYLMNSYPTDAGREINLLHQIGISTNAQGSNTGDVNASRLRGYLEMDEEKFDAAIENNLEAVSQLFGNDTDGDVTVDEGIAYKVEEYLKSFSRSGGIFENRQETLDNRVTRTEDDMDDYGDHLDRYERRLRSEFGRMDEAMQQLDENQRALQRLNNQGGQ